MVTRIISLFGFAALFLLISPVIRGHVTGGLLAVQDVLQNNSPWSYLIAGVGVFAVFAFSLNRGAAPR